MKQNSEYQHALVLGYWLLACAAIVYLMIVVGGITRLTQSGLSMVEWEPIMGIIPPMSEAQWMDVFNKYRQSPEYLKVNAGMSLDAFKQIFYWEYGHRVLGRIIGLIYFLPLVFFMLKGMVPKPWYARLLGLFVLGGLQGLMGWYMVKSGLVDVPHVSQYRLTAHLSLAFVIFGCMIWFALDFLRGETKHLRASPGYLKSTALVVAVVFLMMMSGGFVAGTKAGFIMNTFPKMGGVWFPAGLMNMEPTWRNAFENPITIQFIHRSLAMVVFLTALLSCILSVKQRFKTWHILTLVAVVGQISLGILAILYLNDNAVLFGGMHQAGAVALFSAALLVAHVARKSSRS